LSGSGTSRLTETSDIYLDWNATTPPHPRAIDAMRAAAEQAWANPSSVHAAGRRARALIEDTREELARSLGFAAREVVFTSGGTEANNWAIHSATALVTSRIEHPSVVRAAEALARDGRPVIWLPVPESGRIDPEDVRTALRSLSEPALVALMAANHETGVIQPVQETAEIAHAQGARLHVDAVQALGKLDQALWKDADSVSVAAHKIRGPKGIGALAFRPEWSPKPLLHGGAQERGLRPGTADPVAAAGFLSALEEARASAGSFAEVRTLRDRIERALAEHGAVNGKGAPRLPHVANMSLQGFRGDELVAALDLIGIRVSSGSACSAGTSEPSPVIEAMLGKERALSAVRISLGAITTQEAIDAAIVGFRRVLGARGAVR
jgi:cysteine desulfurase